MFLKSCWMTWNCTDLKATKSRFRMVETKSADNFLVPYRVVMKSARIVLFDWMWAVGHCIQALRVNVTFPQNCLKVTQKLQELSVSIQTLNILRILMLSNFILFAEFCILWTTFSVPWYIFHSTRHLHFDFAFAGSRRNILYHKRIELLQTKRSQL